MELTSFCSSGCGDVRDGYDRAVSYNVMVTAAVSPRTTTPRWRLLWRKIVKKKRKMLFDCSSGSTQQQVVQFSYEPYAYSQNFDDQGSMWYNDYDDISRSFSARFAVPSRIFTD